MQPIHNDTPVQEPQQQPHTMGFWESAAKQFAYVRVMAGSGMLAALGLALKFLNINITQTLRFNFHFMPIAVAGYQYGPLVAGFVGMVIDILGFLVNPTGPYFFGFTFNAFVSGFIYGCWLYRRPVKLWRVLCAVLCSILAVSFILNPLMLQYMYGMPFLTIVAPRVFTNAILVPCYTAMIYVVLRTLERHLPRIVRR